VRERKRYKVSRWKIRRAWRGTRRSWRRRTSVWGKVSFSFFRETKVHNCLLSKLDWTMTFIRFEATGSRKVCVYFARQGSLLVGGTEGQRIMAN
jgi:hypothetical protein